jgi:hypothetical protein
MVAPTREERIRQRLFGDLPSYDRTRGGFTAIPLIFRRAQFLFGPRDFQVYLYIAMRTGPAGIAWFNLSEMAWDLGFANVPKLRPYVNKLVADGWIAQSRAQGKDYYLIIDPLTVLARLKAANKIPQERLDALDELLESLGLPLLQQAEEKPDIPTTLQLHGAEAEVAADLAEAEAALRRIELRTKRRIENRAQRRQGSASEGHGDVSATSDAAALDEAFKQVNDKLTEVAAAQLLKNRQAVEDLGSGTTPVVQRPGRSPFRR